MHPQKSDVLFYVHSLNEVRTLAPLILKFRATPGKKAYVVVSGGSHCPCEETSKVLGWPSSSCHDRRFKIFDLEIGADSRGSMDPPLIQEVFAGMRGLMQIHSPSLVITTNTISSNIRDALTLAVTRYNATLVELPPSAVPYALWMPDVKSVALQCKCSPFLTRLSCLKPLLTWTFEKSNFMFPLGMWQKLSPQFSTRVLIPKDLGHRICIQTIPADCHAWLKWWTDNTWVPVAALGPHLCYLGITSLDCACTCLPPRLPLPVPVWVCLFIHLSLYYWLATVSICQMKVSRDVQFGTRWRSLSAS